MASLNLNGFIVECVEPEGTWEYERLPALLTADKQEILADGIDTATITAQTPNGEAITFYNAETGEEINTGMTLEVSALDSGIIRIRGGRETTTRLNEVSISAIAKE
jgi:hypothetical protein